MMYTQPDKPFLRRHLSASAVAMSLAAAALPLQTHGEALELHLQAPYDLENSTFDLRYLEENANNPYFKRRVAIPYDEVEAEIAKQLHSIVDRTIRVEIECFSIFCPDTHIDITIGSRFEFTKKDQPVIGSMGAAADNRVGIHLATQAKVGLDIHAKSETGIWDSSEAAVGIEALLGAYGNAEVGLWPILSAGNIDGHIAQEGGSVTITGLDDSLIDIGVKVGVLLGGPAGGLVGGLIAKFGADEAEDIIRAEIDKASTDLINEANKLLKAEILKTLNPSIAQAVNLQDALLNTPIPPVNMSMNQLMAASPVSFDVRTRAGGGTTRTVVTTRFDPTPNGGLVEGEIRFPKTKCDYVAIGNNQWVTGYMATSTSPVNDDLHDGKDCAEIIHDEDFLRQIYLGESPEKVLKSGDPANALASWVAGGPLHLSGKAEDRGDYYACSYQIDGLPQAAIIELSSPEGSNLAERLYDRKFSNRYLVYSFGAVPGVLDSRGNPLPTPYLTLGGAGPKDTDECPSAAKGKPVPEVDTGLPDLDPETCPQCGGGLVNNPGGIVSNPIVVGSPITTPPILQIGQMRR
jgi:hypothetical protein